MSGMFGKAMKFAKSKQGKEALAKVQKYAKSEKGKERIEDVKERFTHKQEEPAPKAPGAGVDTSTEPKPDPNAPR
ncbi:MAG: hypothetical protein QOI80_1074 [Solirubrobacteraceae bacterium]|jgi:hypothetical protein|nr:hypothetical protein [Solirubrobacteraceae bacterium]